MNTPTQSTPFRKGAKWALEDFRKANMHLKKRQDESRPPQTPLLQSLWVSYFHVLAREFGYVIKEHYSI
jgi:hypothetical protein